jgi:hypothetical protein
MFEIGSEISNRFLKSNIILMKIAERNMQNNLSAPQTIAYVTAFGNIITLLQLGALEAAKSLVLQIQPDNLVTQQDIDFVLGLLDEAIG